MVTSVNWAWMCSRSGPAKIVRMIEATMSWLPFGTTECTLRMKWTRQRCQAAPWNTVPIAFFKPECASDMTSFTPSRPRTFNDLRNAVQNPSFFRVSDVEADHFAASGGGDPDGDDDRLGDDPVVHPRFDIGGVEEHVWVVEGR